MWQNTLHGTIKDQGIDTSNGPALTEIVTMLAERCKTLKEMASASRYFFEEFESFDEAAVKKHFKAAAIEPLEKSKKKKLTALSQELTGLKTTLAEKRKNIFPSNNKTLNNLSNSWAWNFKI